MKSVLFSFINWWTWLLTFTSGFANVCTLLLFGTAVTHHTGTISRLPITYSNHNMSNHIFLLGLIFSFFVGSVLSGILFHEQVLKPKKRYGILLILLGLFLMIVNTFGNSTTILYAVSFLSGSQNAMFLYVKNYLARTTHLTGYLTDTGFALGRIIAGYRNDWPKFLFNLSQILVFVLGGYLATYVQLTMPEKSIPIIAFLYILAGFIYFIVRRNNLFGFSSTKQTIK